MSAVRVAMVLCGGLFLVLGPLLPADGDLWWQRWLGELILRTHHLPWALGPETFTAAGAPWVPQEWLFSMLVAIAMRHGAFIALSLMVSILPLGILWTIYARARDRATPMAIAVALICSSIALEGSFGMRAQVLGWGGFAALLLLLRRRDGWYYAAIPVVAIWANVHASAVLAPVFLAVRIVGAVADGGPSILRTDRDLRILPLVAVALLCTPLGWHLPAYSLALAASPIRQYIQEWQPAALGDPEFLLGALPLALLVAIGGQMTLRKKAESLPIAMLFVGVLLARRNIPLFAIAAAPLAAQSLSVRFPRLRELAERFAGTERFAIILILIALTLSGATLAWARQRVPTVPAAAIDRLARTGEHRLFCENFNSCSVALQYPNVHVFMDGRCDPYPLKVWRSYISTIRVEDGWKQILRAYKVDAIVVSRGGAFATALASDDAWRAAFRDGSFVLFVRAHRA